MTHPTTKRSGSRFRFISEIIAELKKVVWLTRREAAYLTVLVLIVAITAGLVLGAIDYGFTSLVDKLFILPGYVLVQMRMSDQSWNIVRNTPGVTGFVGSGNKPASLPEEEVNRILKQMTTEAPRVKVGFRQGQSIRVIDGPFIDFMGVVDDINEKRGKVKVLLSLFGRETPVELDFLQVEKL